jgi:hypothetical protein
VKDEQGRPGGRTGATMKEPVQHVPYDESRINTIRGKSLLYPREIAVEIRELCRMLDWCYEEWSPDSQLENERFRG